MDRDHIRNLLLKAIAEIQHQSGREDDTLDDNTRPFIDLEGFDSLNGEEVTICLLDDLSFDDGLNPFESRHGKEVTIGQIANRLAAVAKEKKAS